MIDKKIDEIIIKYNIDKYYPSFKKKLNAELQIQNLSLEWKEKKIACICVSDVCRKRFEKVVSGIENLEIDYIIVEYADSFMNNIILSRENVDFKKYDEIWNISYHGAYFINNYFFQHNIRCLSLYDYLEVRDLIFDDEWFSLFQHNTGVFSSDNVEKLQEWNNYSIVEYISLRNKYENAENKYDKKHYLEKMLFVALYIKDFVKVFNLLDALICYDKAFTNVKNEISELLECIKKDIAERCHKDIIVYWIDKVPYKDFGKLNKTYAMCNDNAYVFNNFYTMNPYTIPSFAQMFAGMHPVDDDGCFASKNDIEKGELIKKLEAAGYAIVLVSADFEEKCDTKHQTNTYHDEYTTGSEVLWDSLCTIIKSKKPVFVIAHINIEGHEPNMSIAVRNLFRREKRYEECLRYIDDQLDFYGALFQNSCTEIFMSDHGKNDFKSRFHIIMAVKSQSIGVGHDDELHCLLDFCELIEDILGDCKPFGGRGREYIEIQDYNHMSGFDIGVAIKKKGRIEQLIKGYRGIITKEYIYVQFSSGIEWMCQNNKDEGILFEPIWYQRIGDLDACKNVSVLEKFRLLVKKRKVESYRLSEHEKYNKYVWKIYHKAYSKNIEKVKLINQMFEEIEDNSIVIRFGGYHTVGMLSILSKENIDKIKCIVDIDSNCLCKGLGIEISPKIPDYARTVIISSKQYSDNFSSNDAKAGNDIRIINPYEYLENNGIFCRFSLFEFEPAYDDYNVDYPFEEFRL